MTIRKPLTSSQKFSPSPQGPKSPSKSSNAFLLSPDKLLPAIPTSGDGSPSAQSLGTEERPAVKEHTWVEVPGSNEQANKESPSHARIENSGQSSSQTRAGTPQPSLQLGQGVMITPRTSSESLRNRPSTTPLAIAIVPSNEGSPVPKSSGRSLNNPIYQTNRSQQVLANSEKEARSNAEANSYSGNANSDNGLNASLSCQYHHFVEPWNYPACAPEPFSENVASVPSGTGIEASSNERMELQDGTRVLRDQYGGTRENGNDTMEGAPNVDKKTRDSLGPTLSRPTTHATATQDVPAPNLPPHPRQQPHDAMSQSPQITRPLTDATTAKDLARTTPSANASPGESSETRRASETYQIRLINWYDASSTTNPRRSPVMVQNANGPCPLLALVNALVLSTPSSLTTPLVETLRVREQVSLGLLLDAVIDELMSQRRGGAAQTLPDVSELYAFLLTLHTGMNINPCFVLQEEEVVNLIDAPIDDPTNMRCIRRLGGFEETRETKLYSTFGVPLIHGWIPPIAHPAFESLKRAARTYEDAQNILFREEELEQKLKNQGLSPEDQVMLEDIGSIKHFLCSTATQLTGYGLDTITEALAPGTIAILFRNDHFSTLYRHPRSGQLLNLVTDMGYAGHDEVVWESLVDVSGEGCEFFAGDFQPVSHVTSDAQQSNCRAMEVDDAGWETVCKKSQKSSRTNQTGTKNPVQSSSGAPPLEKLHLDALSPTTEQEDHDLALAMQLQEEEEERERREAAARRREDELSQAYLDNADAQGRRTFPGFARGAQRRPNVPPRGGSGPNTRSTPSGRRVHSTQSFSEDLPPPSYEQAAQGPAYHPPVNHPAHPHAASPSPGENTPRAPTGRARQGSSAYIEQAVAYGGSSSIQVSSRRKPGKGRNPAGTGQLDGAPGVVRGRSDMAGSAITDDDRKEKDCVVM